MDDWPGPLTGAERSKNNLGFFVRITEKRRIL